MVLLKSRKPFFDSPENDDSCQPSEIDNAQELGNQLMIDRDSSAKLKLRRPARKFVDRTAELDAVV